MAHPVAKNHISPIVYTLGHSTRPLEEFIALLRGHGVRRVADVRTIPRSRHNPQFNGPDLARALRNRGLSYLHLKALGGLRRPRPDSRNTAWRHASFRGFADYMETPEFEQALERLLELAKEKPTAILCAEAVPWRCHRNLIADALVARDVSVRHITGSGRPHEHALSAIARVRAGRVTYPGEETLF